MTGVIMVRVRVRVGEYDSRILNPSGFPSLNEQQVSLGNITTPERFRFQAGGQTEAQDRGWFSFISEERIILTGQNGPFHVMDKDQGFRVRPPRPRLHGDLPEPTVSLAALYYGPELSGVRVRFRLESDSTG